MILVQTGVVSNKMGVWKILNEGTVKTMTLERTLTFLNKLREKRPQIPSISDVCNHSDG
jgi:hypothetical protein